MTTTLKQARNRQEAALRMALMGFPSTRPSSLDAKQSEALMSRLHSAQQLTPQEHLERLRELCQQENSGQT